MHPSVKVWARNGIIATLYDFGSKFGRKTNENVLNFFFVLKNIFKRAQKSGFIKIINSEPIFAEKT